MHKRASSPFMTSALEQRYRSRSFWLDTLPGSLTPRAALERDIDVDVAIVGAGYTGLWTAYELARRDPTLRIAVLEAEIAGFGASGRNGGWCSALFAGSRETTAKAHGRDAAVALQRALFATVDEVGAVAAEQDRRALPQGRHARAGHIGGPGPPAASPGRARAHMGLRRSRRALAGARRSRGAPQRGGRARCGVHAALRARASGPARTRSRRRRRAPRRHDLRADARQRDLTAAGRDARRSREGRRRGAGDRGLHRPAAGAPAHARAVVLPHDRDRAAPRRASGTPSAGTDARRSATAAT